MDIHLRKTLISNRSSCMGSKRKVHRANNSGCFDLRCTFIFKFFFAPTSQDLSKRLNWKNDAFHVSYRLRLHAEHNQRIKMKTHVYTSFTNFWMRLYHTLKQDAMLLLWAVFHWLNFVKICIACLQRKGHKYCVSWRRIISVRSWFSENSRQQDTCLFCFKLYTTEQCCWWFTKGYNAICRNNPGRLVLKFLSFA